MNRVGSVAAPVQVVLRKHDTKMKLSFDVTSNLRKRKDKIIDTVTSNFRVMVYLQPSRRFLSTTH